MVSVSHAILFVEDNPSLLKLYGEVVLASIGCEPLLVNGYESMVEVSRELRHLKIAFVDLNLGEGKLSGIDVYTWLRGHEFHGPVYFLTGHGKGSPFFDAAEQIPDSRVLSKPLPIEILVRIIREAID